MPDNSAPDSSAPDSSAAPGPRGRPAPEVLTLVGASLAAVQERPVRFAERFYSRLFERAPHLRGLFPADLSPQSERLAGALRAAMETATSADPEKIAGFEHALQKMGARHATHYRVPAVHYPLIGDALVQAARDVAGVHWSTRTSSAWVAVYEWLAGHMVRGAAAAGDRSPIPASLHRAVSAAATPTHTTAPAPTSVQVGAAGDRAGHPGVHDVTWPLPVLPPEKPGRAPHRARAEPDSSPPIAGLPLDGPLSDGASPEEQSAAVIEGWTAAQLARSPLSVLVSAGAHR